MSDGFVIFELSALKSSSIVRENALHSFFDRGKIQLIYLRNYVKFDYTLPDTVCLSIQFPEF